ncbi:MAG: hypothetical protein R3E77_11680 [Steroidobacteraceae bacterium]
MLTTRQHLKIKAILLALVLVTAQASALAHTYTHLRSGTQTSTEPSLPDRQLCGDCLTGNALLGAAPPPADITIALTPLRSTYARRETATRPVQPVFSFQARAPPLLPVV